MPVNTAMNSAIGTDSTPIRRIWLAVSPPHVPTSLRARATDERKYPMRPNAANHPATRPARRSYTGPIYTGLDSAGRPGRRDSWDSRGSGESRDGNGGGGRPAGAPGKGEG